MLIDADQRVISGVDDLISRNLLNHRFKFLHGAISEGSGLVHFQEDDFMSSSLEVLSFKTNRKPSVSIPIIDQSIILTTLPPPYDLVKIDVEGAEYDFLVAYEEILKLTHYLVIEWHSWYRGGGSSEQIKEAIR